ncbi:MAG: hypothetical protein ABI954_04060 [Pyrinomonadaceae bacterium]
MKRPFLFLMFLLVSNIGIAAQGVRQPTKTTTTSQTPQTTEKTDVSQNTNPQMPKPQPAPNTFAAQYQGGLFGYDKKTKGTLTYDDLNKRFVFRNVENKEIFGLPYKSLMVIYGSSKSVRPTAATVASAIPSIYAIPFGFIRSKNRYLIVEFSDPDSDVRGTASFKIANKALLQSVVQSLGEKAELKQRGDAFYRPRESQKPVL